MIDPHHLLLRSARPDDLDALERFAASAGLRARRAIIGYPSETEISAKTILQVADL